ncbi:MAG: hypothetical protein IBX56_17075 [Methylomicrobium sp.]|nr:hypothetical protein [Methylomicrobium sp.]
MGPNNPIDPTEQVGTWSIVQQGQDFRRVTYTYGVESYTFEVHEPTAGVYNFCGIVVAENIIGATIQDAANQDCP